MNIEIVYNNDENFQLDFKKIGSEIKKTPVEPTVVPELEEAKQENSSNAAPLENVSKGHPFDPFAGTSWEGRKQGFN